ncbi:deoxyribodipyrimidine photo-lyase [Thalassotalea marina]|uniref:Deoxyribodipyrimidine photo-lyase n=1 Tax=Thalassotalea marina TaxID=1673741 RepID=A0A919BNT3_9GAMM|nr:deoxyribodipyrimidine photo-lyase [Thalassotalea marina]
MLLWFRGDLRVRDNPALSYFIQHKHADDKAIVFLMPEQWKNYHWSAIKIDFIKRHIRLLKSQLTTLGINLEVVEVADIKEQTSYLIKRCQQQGHEVVASSELEINERQRDQKIMDAGIKLHLFESDVIVPKGAVLTQSGDMYKVFTAFKKAWLSYMRMHGLTLADNAFNQVEQTKVNDIALLTGDESSVKWPLVTDVEQSVIPTFLRDKLEDYHEQRDFPAIKGTSGLSPYLAIGALSSRYVLRQLLQRCPDLLTATDSAEFSWLNELIWRDFYRHLMHFRQDLCTHKSYNDKYQQMDWPNKQVWFDAWCQGKTGYPFVDAAMRQLNQTGWMHNRLRMVVASFLTKHLLIDWRWGEQYFMKQLIDGDLAANNGGWQWAASTGCDAQPYFRVFNPIRQSERFDPSGDFIRKYLPELANVPDKHIHFPHKYLKEINSSVYWPALVDHKAARENALAFYKV